MSTADTAANGVATGARSTEPVCHFLNLAGELKNRIYRMVLLTDDSAPIRVSSRGYERPALLQTCKEVRREAFGIFYYENRFATEVEDYNIAVILRFSDSLNHIWRLSRSNPIRIKVRQDQMKVRYQSISNRPSWFNLMNHMREIHRGYLRTEISEPSQSYEADERNGTLLAHGAMYHTAATLEDQPWEIVEKVLHFWRPTLALEHAAWMDD